MVIKLKKKCNLIFIMIQTSQEIDILRNLNARFKKKITVFYPIKLTTIRHNENLSVSRHITKNTLPPFTYCAFSITAAGNRCLDLQVIISLITKEKVLFCCDRQVFFLKGLYLVWLNICPQF